MDQTICLNMIVKDEAHIIEDTLSKLLKKVPIKYWVISDTGSSDDTIAKIEGFFKERGIPGEIHHDEWKNFSHNRSRALEEAYNKTDYLLIFDADDEITGNFVLPKRLTADAYNLKLGTPVFSYERPLLINNRRKWEFKSVIHEFLAAKEPNMVYSKIDGDYFVISGKSGARSKDPQKYLKDAQLLERSYEESLVTKDDLHNRYAFYCANSYKDAGIPDKAIEWYKKTLTLNGWIQEKYVSCIRLFELLRDKGEVETGMYYLVKSHSYDRERLDGIYHLVNHYCTSGESEVAHAYYSLVGDHYENNYMRNYTSDKLFVDVNVYKFFMPYFMVIVAERLKKYELGIKMYRIVFETKPEHVGEWHNKMFLYNLQFFMRYASKPFIKQAKEYVKWLMSRGFNVASYDFVDAFKSYDIFPKTRMFTNDECAASKNILFYTGYSNEPWNYTYSLTNALGGSETAVAYLTSYFRKDYTIYVCGGVKEETVGNVKYVPLDKIAGLVRSTPFRTAVISRYVGFLEQYTFSAHKVYIWAHDTHLLPYGCNLSVEELLQKYHQNIDGVVCLTQWHKELFQKQYPLIANKISIINNGLKEDLFNIDVPKNKNQFVYTSCSERGLNRLLELWESILEKMPDAQLRIASYGPFPKNDEDREMEKIIKKHPDSIQHLGKLGSKDLYTLLCSSEYWLYPTCWQETSCITALEMLRCGVICVYYPLAGLPFTMNGNGFETSHGKEIDTIMSLTDEQKSEAIRKGKEYAASCTWKNRSKVWDPLVFDTPIKVLNLPRRKDRRNEMVKRLAKADLPSYEFVDGVDGQALTGTNDLKRQFLHNKFMYRRGVLGCVLGHMKIWKMLASSESSDYYVVFEDDVFPQTNAHVDLSRVCADFVNNKHEFTYIGRFNLSMGQHTDDIFIDEYTDTYKKLQWGSYSYIISKSAAIKLTEYYKTNPFINILDTADNLLRAGVTITYTNRAVTTSFFTTFLSPGDSDVKHLDHENAIDFEAPDKEVLMKDSYSFPIRVINLDRRTDRKNNMVERFKSKRVEGYSFFSAFDGTTIPTYEFINSVFHSNNFYSMKSICAAGLSHFELWRQLIHSDDEYSIIFEDDVELAYQFPDKLDKLLVEFKEKNMDFMFLGANMVTYCTNSDISELGTVKIDYSNVGWSGGGFGYIIRKSAAAKLLDYMCKYGWPYAVDSLLIHEKLNLSCYYLTDSIVSTKMATNKREIKSREIDSDIQYNRETFSFNNSKRHPNSENVCRKYYFLDGTLSMADAEKDLAE